MATDNDSILKNRDAERSLFGYKETLRTSQGLGVVSVVNLQLALPKDTIKLRHGVAFEMKPTTDKLSTSIRSNFQNYCVPFSAIWKYWDSFVSKGSQLIQNGGFNTPYLQSNEDESVKVLPTIKIARLFGYFLAGAGSGSFPNPNRCLKKSIPGNASDFTGKFEGNRQNWQYGYYSTGAYSEDSADSIRGGIPLWWTPRIIKTGPKTSVFSHTPLGSNGLYYNNIVTNDASIILSAECMGFDVRGVAGFNAPYLVITQSYVKEDGKVYYNMCWAKDLRAATSTSSGIGTYIASSSNYIFAVDTLTDSSHRYGAVSFNSAPLGTSDEYTGNYRRLYLSSSLGQATTQKAIRAFNLACVMLFNNPEMLGQGSLLEQMGVSLFERRNVYEAKPSFMSDGWNYAMRDNPFSLDLSYWSVNYNILKEIADGSFNISVNVLPFYAYQKIITDRFLLRHETLSNNTGNDSTVDYTTKFDSPYFRNNMVPTMCYYHPRLGNSTLDIDDYAFYVTDPSSGNMKWALVDDGTTEDSFDASLWHYSCPINQLLTIFLSRNALLQFDAFQKIWQKQDHNVQTLLTANTDAVVDANRKIDVKKFLMAHAFGKFVRYGGNDQLASKVIENVYGINDIPECSTNVILLNSRKHVVATNDVLNTGGAVSAESGEPLALGEKSTIANDQLDVANDCNFFANNFSYIISLHWFDSEVIRAKVPNFCTNKLGRNGYALREKFETAFFPMYQSLGDDPLTLGDIEFGGDMTNVVGWMNKNSLLKDAEFNRVTGEFLDKFAKQIVSSTPVWKSRLYGPSLTYGYLQPITAEYQIPLVDKFGDALLCSWVFETYKKSCMTKSNIVGL